MKDWEVIADSLSKPGLELGWVSALDVEGRMIWIFDAYGYGKRFVVRADQKLTALWNWNRRFAPEIRRTSGEAVKNGGNY
jgi:hypothetical protein